MDPEGSSLVTQLNQLMDYLEIPIPLESPLDLTPQLLITVELQPLRKPHKVNRLE